jgi:hypothetical protein
MLLLARSEAYQQGALDSATRMDRLWYNQLGYTAVCGYGAANQNERVGGVHGPPVRGARRPPIRSA